MTFVDRRDAGQRLAKHFLEYRGRDAIVLGLPRGGVITAKAVADSLELPLDIIVARKIGAPDNPDFAIGAVAEGGEPLIDSHVVAIFAIPDSYVQTEITNQRREIARRREFYRGGRPLPHLRGKSVILIDDGIATGFTMLAAIQAVRSSEPSEIVVGVPVASKRSIEQIASKVDRIVTVMSPEPFIAVGRWYDRFSEVSDQEVAECLAQRGELPAALSSEPLLENVER